MLSTFAAIIILSGVTREHRVYCRPLVVKRPKKGEKSWKTVYSLQFIVNHKGKCFGGVGVAQIESALLTRETRRVDNRAKQRGPVCCLSVGCWLVWKFNVIKPNASRRVIIKPRLIPSFSLTGLRNSS